MHENPDLPHPDPVLNALELEAGSATSEFLVGVRASLFHGLALGGVAKADGGDRAAAASRAVRIFEALSRRERASPRALAAAVTERWYGEARVESRAQAAAIRSYLAGRIAAGLEAPVAAAQNLREYAARVTDGDPAGERALAYARERAAELVQGLNDATRKQVALEVIEHQLTPAGDAGRLERRLDDAFATLNRDNRRVAITETGINHQNGFLAGLAPGDEVDFNAAPDACPHCRKFHGKRFKVVEGPGDHHTEVWVGKSNFGRSFHLRKIDGTLRTPDELAGPVVPAHPNCRCRWLRALAAAGAGVDPRMEAMLDDLLALPAGF